VRYILPFDKEHSFENLFSKMTPEKARQGAFFTRAFLELLHQILHSGDLYSKDQILQELKQNSSGLNSIFKLFCDKFDPYSERALEVPIVEKNSICEFLLHLVECLVRTNFFVPEVDALSFRFDAHLLDGPFECMKKKFPISPYGTYFIINEDFLGFHVRFQNLARGGLRTVFGQKNGPRSTEGSLAFSECYHLARTQQLKNKDIPEGGAKGVIFLLPVSRLDLAKAQDFLYACQKKFIKSLLMLVVSDENGELKNPLILDYLKSEELLFLGPDENMHDAMIDWIAEYAENLHYKPGSAFISGKPLLGINHKEFGVTSLGVNTSLIEVLKYLKIDPEKMPFTVKMTGGPDGDVAGNEILNLANCFPDTARLICIQDVSGVLCDPKGLDFVLLKSLCKHMQPIRFYPYERLSADGFLLDMSEKEALEHPIYTNTSRSLDTKFLQHDEAEKMYRNFLHGVAADVFIPAGGRPYTLNEHTLTSFYLEPKKPSVKTICEGANLYLSSPARKALEDDGVIIIKDSTANKGGVICSSYEVLCCLVLSKKEFLDHKPEIIAQIKEKIVECMLLEVSCILSSHDRTKMRCSEISDKISEDIQLLRKEFSMSLNEQKIKKEDSISTLFLEFCLPILRQKFSDRLFETLPPEYIKAAIAAYSSSRKVYMS